MGKMRKSQDRCELRLGPQSGLAASREMDHAGRVLPGISIGLRAMNVRAAGSAIRDRGAEVAEAVEKSLRARQRVVQKLFRLAQPQSLERS